MNHFELFALPLRFSIDNQWLDGQFRELQRRFHPDNFAQASEQDRLISVQKAAQINQAYQILKNPISRAEHLISEEALHAKALGEPSFQFINEHQTLQDPIFLMEQMDLREELETIAELAGSISERDVATERFADFEAKINELYKQQVADLADELNQSLWQQAAERLNKLKFIAKLKQEIERVEERLLD